MANFNFIVLTVTPSDQAEMCDLCGAEWLISVKYR